MTPYPHIGNTRLVPASEILAGLYPKQIMAILNNYWVSDTQEQRVIQIRLHPEYCADRNIPHDQAHKVHQVQQAIMNDRIMPSVLEPVEVGLDLHTLRQALHLNANESCPRRMIWTQGFDHPLMVVPGKVFTLIDPSVAGEEQAQAGTVWELRSGTAYQQHLVPPDVYIKGANAALPYSSENAQQVLLYLHKALQQQPELSDVLVSPPVAILPPYEDEDAELAVLEPDHGNLLSALEYAEPSAMLTREQILQVCETVVKSLYALDQCGVIHGRIDPAHITIHQQAGNAEPSLKLSGFESAFDKSSFPHHSAQREWYVDSTQTGPLHLRDFKMIEALLDVRDCASPINKEQSFIKACPHLAEQIRACARNAVQLEALRQQEWIRLLSAVDMFQAGCVLFSILCSLQPAKYPYWHIDQECGEHGLLSNMENLRAAAVPADIEQMILDMLQADYKARPAPADLFKLTQSWQRP